MHSNMVLWSLILFLHEKICFLIYFYCFYSASEITELYTRFSKKLGANQYHLERNNNPSNGFYTYIAVESGDIFTTRCTDQVQVHRMYIDGLSKHAEDEGFFEQQVNLYIKWRHALWCCI